MGLQSIGTPVMWVGFIAFVLAMLALDLGVFHRKTHAVTTREALGWTGVWVGLALLFNVGVYVWFGPERALEFLTGYLIEKALSVDNLFVFLVLFSYFAVPAALQHRVLYWGILGALVMRAGFILAGAALVQRFHAVIYVFGAFLVFTGVKLLVHRDEEMEPAKNPVLRLFRRMVPMVPDYRGTTFLVKEAGRWLATPLLLVVVAKPRSADLDGFAITTDPFIVFTSNIFAILGLRALFFLLAGMMGKLRYLKFGLGMVLAFVGAKMLLVDIWKVPIGLSLGIVAGLLGLSAVASLVVPVKTDAGNTR